MRHRRGGHNHQRPALFHRHRRFHDRQERVAEAALADAAILAAAGYEVQWVRQHPPPTAPQFGSGPTKPNSAVSGYRFFPTVKDDQFGYVLHVVDLAINKVMGAASRREPRDIVDLLTLHDHVLPVGALVWAAVETAPGYMPEGLIGEIRRNARYPATELRQLSAAAVMARLHEALDDAEKFVAAMQSDKAGPVQPDPALLDAHTTHTARRRGHWPSSPDITAAMLAHCRRRNCRPPTAFHW